MEMTWALGIITITITITIYMPILITIILRMV